ncbi:uncharacterized protein BDR25DRAFT_354162 [Lindgomyces ingoldianus]|uniref:Uncharacterized protein n=1 Tax=Lindgomyces ingoldianus TaxID=673940 RepID=A0ACB6QXQ8_9PLEO|nr:uncharacterized protein BDR25DRAFT_354162 [Lindgomyces ingoldianus]KAF2471660.1 hypothetical protein BDR25DRAFT_354162 [Lindgomyces ingoldianus]
MQLISYRAQCSEQPDEQGTVTLRRQFPYFGNALVSRQKTSRLVHLPIHEGGVVVHYLEEIYMTPPNFELKHETWLNFHRTQISSSASKNKAHRAAKPCLHPPGIFVAEASVCSVTSHGILGNLGRALDYGIVPFRQTEYYVEFNRPSHDARKACFISLVKTPFLKSLQHQKRWEMLHRVIRRHEMARSVKRIQSLQNKFAQQTNHPEAEPRRMEAIMPSWSRPLNLKFSFVNIDDMKTPKRYKEAAPGMNVRIVTYNTKVPVRILISIFRHFIDFQKCTSPLSALISNLHIIPFSRLGQAPPLNKTMPQLFYDRPQAAGASEISRFPILLIFEVWAALDRFYRSESRDYGQCATALIQFLDQDLLVFLSGGKFSIQPTKKVSAKVTGRCFVILSATRETLQSHIYYQLLALGSGCDVGSCWMLYYSIRDPVRELCSASCCRNVELVFSKQDSVYYPQVFKNIFNLPGFYLFTILTSLTAGRETPRAEKYKGYFNFKRLKIYAI